MNVIYIENKNHEADSVLNEFELYKMPSSNVEFFGIAIDGRFFIQFKSACYIFYKVPLTLMNSAINCDSIGKFFVNNIKGKFESNKIEEKLVKEELA